MKTTLLTLACVALATVASAGAPGGSWTIHSGHPHWNCWDNIATGDFNGDGSADPVCADSWSPTRIYVFLGDAANPAPVDWTEPPGGGSQTHYGASIASAGDVDGNGYDDLLVGASGWGAEGAAFLHYGTAFGPVSLPGWSVFGTLPASPLAGLGSSVSGAGDVDGDGYDDVIVADPAQDRALLFRGGPLGLAGEPAWTLSQAVTTVAGVGDLNNDGYDDVAIGDSGYAPAGGPAGAGRARVYLGSSTGLQPAQTIEGTEQSLRLGHSVDGAGDVNGDGYDDLILGGPSFWAWEDYGQVYVHHGSAAGVSTTPAWQTSGRRPSDYSGWSVSAAGDVNDDGYDDVLVGSMTQFESTNPATCCSLSECETCVAYYPGAAFLYLGSAQGLASCPSWTVEGLPTSSDQMGTYVTGGTDIDDDGYDDWLVRLDGGSGRVYFGGAAFPDADADGDGFCAEADCDDDDPEEPALTWHQDRDFDGFGDPDLPWLSCTQGAGFVADGTDCDDLNPDLWHPAEDVTLTMGPARDRLSWTSQMWPPADFDVIRGTTSDWPIGAGSGEACVATDRIETWLNDTVEPTTSVCLWYLVRAENGCGGTYGVDGGLLPRESQACP